MSKLPRKLLLGQNAKENFPAKGFFFLGKIKIYLNILQFGLVRVRAQPCKVLPMPRAAEEYRCGPSSN